MTRRMSWLAAAIATCTGLATASCSGGSDTTPAQGAGAASATTSGAGGAGGGSGGGETGGGAGAPSNCTEITVGAIDRSYDLLKTAVQGPVSPQLGSAALGDWLSIELYEISGYHQANGMFDLAAGADANYSTCNHCMLVYEDENDATGDIARTYFQISGTLMLDEVTSNPVSADNKGSLSDLTLVEVTIDPDTYVSTPVPGGACLHLTKASWDTSAPLGTPCSAAEDCGDFLTKVCDPATQTCALGMCDFSDPPTKPCPSGEVCRPQEGIVAWGACYPSCTPFGAPGCAAGYDCVSYRDDQSAGACYAQGTTGPSATCTPSVLTTSCVAGYRCMDDGSGSVCVKACDYFAAAPGCDAGGRCITGSVCTTQMADAAPIGAPCAATSSAGTFCGDDGTAYRGACDDSAGPLTCRKICRADTPADCTAPATCTVASGTLGVCAP